jgi:hypothetical protein
LGKTARCDAALLITKQTGKELLAPVTAIDLPKQIQVIVHHISEPSWRKLH